MRRSLLYSVIFPLLALSFPPVVQASENATLSLPALRQAADAGDGDAQFALGAAYLKGSGVEKDYYRGERLLEAAAKHGSTKAMMLMANMYFSGESHAGTQEDAFQEVLHAARLGSVQAMTALAVMYWIGGPARPDAQNGLGGILPANHHHARQWITLARMHAKAGEVKTPIIKLQILFTQGMPVPELKALAEDVSHLHPEGAFSDLAAADYRQNHRILPPPDGFFPAISAHDDR